MSAPASSDAAWRAYQEAAARITSRIDPIGYSDVSPDAVRGRAAERLDALRAFMATLGSPERRLPVVHVTGTSGKGSTAAAIASLLHGAGLRTGLATSPYLQVMTEKLQVDGSLVSGEALLRNLDEVEEAEHRWVAAGNAPLAYGQLWTALMLHWFDAEAVDVAVIEVGAGGRFDLTNIVRPVASVITSIGLDHLATLGPTLADVAWHKAGIIKSGAPIVTGPLPSEGLAAVETAVAETGSRWIVAGAGDRTPGDGPAFVRQNQRVALATVTALADAGFINRERIEPGRIGDARMPGRLEVMPGTAPLVILDGAHNPDKIRAVVAEFARRQSLGEPKPVVLFAALGAKDAAASLQALSARAERFVFTESPVIGKPATPASRLATLASDAGFAGGIEIEPNASAALDRALAAASGRGCPVLVTGSLYLLGAVRDAWYPREAIVGQRTCWPIRDGTPETAAG